jgi:hypothetical protein
MSYASLRILAIIAAAALAAPILASCNSQSPTANSDPSIVANAEAAEFFNGAQPRKVSIPDELRGKPNDLYGSRKETGTLRGKTVKLFYTINKAGQIGQMYTDDKTFGDADDVSGSIEMTRQETVDAAVACGTDFFCALAVLDKAKAECEKSKTAEDCWMCREVSGNSQDECLPIFMTMRADLRTDDD